MSLCTLPSRRFWRAARRRRRSGALPRSRPLRVSRPLGARPRHFDGIKRNAGSALSGTRRSVWQWWSSSSFKKPETPRYLRRSAGRSHPSEKTIRPLRRCLEFGMGFQPLAMATSSPLPSIYYSRKAIGFPTFRGWVLESFRQEQNPKGLRKPVLVSFELRPQVATFCLWSGLLFWSFPLFLCLLQVVFL